MLRIPDPPGGAESTAPRGPLGSLPRSDVLAALRAAQESLANAERELAQAQALNAGLLVELEETNRGVVALYTEEHQLALTLQRTFLPDKLPEVPGIELAVRYLPAAGQSEIGGDFYEAISTPQGLLLAVGDVMGHSLQAAIVMGELRHGLRAYVAEGHPPHVLLQRLDTLLNRYRPGWTATVCIALIDPDLHHLHLANAGHLPPLLITAPGHAHYLTDHGPLLGLHTGPPHPTTTHRLHPGTRLLMITDGLIERRGTTLDHAQQELRQIAAHSPANSQTLCDTLLNTFAADQQDDIVIFTAHLHP